MPTVLYRPEVAEDIRETAEWYDQKREGLGDDFQTQFWLAMDAITERPLTFAKTSAGTRVSRLSRFPYVIHFQYNKDDEHIVVYAVMYGGRDTSTWIDRV